MSSRPFGFAPRWLGHWEETRTSAWETRPRAYVRRSVSPETLGAKGTEGKVGRAAREQSRRFYFMRVGVYAEDDGGSKAAREDAFGDPCAAADAQYVRRLREEAGVIVKGQESHAQAYVEPLDEIKPRPCFAKTLVREAGEHR